MANHMRRQSGSIDTTAHDPVRERGPAYPAGGYDERSARYDQTSDAGGRSQVQTASGLNIILGLWLIIAPWVLDYSSQNNAVWNQVVIGIAVATLALVRAAAPAKFAGLSWTNFVLGAWLVVAPFVLRYNDTTNTALIYWNDIIVGVLILALAAWSAMATPKR
jgi:hypothetical protein